MTYFAWSSLHFRSAQHRIGLEAIRMADGQFSLNWNRNAALLLKAKRAKLTIADGRAWHQIMLDSTQLRSGKILYSASSPQVQFQLDVYIDDKHSVSETVQAFLAPVAAAKKPEGAKLVAPIPSPMTATGTVQPSREAKSSTQAARPIVRVRKEPVASPRVEADKMSQQHPPKIQEPQVKEQKISAPMPVRILRKPEKRIYFPPRPLQKIMPDAGPFRGTMRAGGHVSVRLRIDDMGHVVAAEAVEHDPDLDGLLVDASVAAARGWTFQPATVNGKPLPAGYVIVFEFHGSAQQ